MTQPLPMSDLPSPMTLGEQVNAFYKELSLKKLHQLKSIYSDDVEFLDPVTAHKGLSQLNRYFENLLKGCTSCRFNINDLQMEQHQGWIRWTMLFAHPKLNSGKTVEVDGMSLVKIYNNKISYQQDFYDMGAMVYEQLPLIGSVIKFIRKRMA